MTETCKFFQLAEVITETGAVNHLFWTFITFSLSLSRVHIQGLVAVRVARRYSSSSSLSRKSRGSSSPL